MRTFNLATIAETDPILLNPLEDMIMKGPSSLLCTCEPDSEFYNPSRCNPSLYRAEVDVNRDEFLTTMREYRVHITINYNFKESL